jgi:hypothetical protein
LLDHLPSAAMPIDWGRQDQSLGGLEINHVIDDDLGAPARGSSTIARPMPLLPPVTTANFSFNVMIVPHYALAH